MCALSYSAVSNALVAWFIGLLVGRATVNLSSQQLHPGCQRNIDIYTIRPIC